MKNKIKTLAPAFHFFQAVSLLEKHYLTQANSAFKGVGKNSSFSEELIRFSVSPSLASPKSDIAFIEDLLLGENTYSRVEVNFLGLHGASSPLPTHYTEKLTGREEEDNPVKQFLDFFHHRSISMCYQIWKKYRYHIQYQCGAKDPHSKRMLHLLGISGVMQELQASDLDQAKLLSYVNQLSTRTRSPKLLSGIVGHYFNLSKVHIEQWVFRRVEIHPSQKNTLGKKNCTLGQDWHVGEHLSDVVGKFNLCFDDIDFQTYKTFLPKGKHHHTLLGLMRFILRDAVVWDLKMRLKLNAIPLNKLGHGNLLGQTSWLGKPTNQNAQTRIIGRL